MEVVTPKLTAATAILNSLVVNHIQNKELSGLFDSLTALSDRASATAATVADAQNQFSDFVATSTQQLKALFDKIDKVALDLDKLAQAKDGITIDSQLILPNGLSVDSLTALSGELAVIGDVNFIGRPYFTSDTAGFAVIHQGATAVDISFDRPYLDQPIVSASITDNINSTTPTSTAFAESIFSNDIRYVVTNKNENGFSIVINKPAPSEVSFSWIALAVKSAKLFSSLDIVASSTPAVLGASTSTSSSSANSTSTSATPPDLETSNSSSTSPSSEQATSSSASLPTQATSPQASTSTGENTQENAAASTTTNSSSNPSPPVSLEPSLTTTDSNQ